MLCTETQCVFERDVRYVDYYVIGLPIKIEINTVNDRSSISLFCDCCR